MIFLLIIIFILVIILTYAYTNQDKFFFLPDVLPENFEFDFDDDFEELYFEVDKNVYLNSILFKTKHRKRGLIYYLHGNSGCVESWGQIAKIYIQRGYDLLLLDYRGYGKSDGRISNESELLSDVQYVYDKMKDRYSEQKIVLIGCSIGTGLAAHLGSVNNPKKVILIAPYFSMKRLVNEIVPFVPNFYLKFRLMTNFKITDIKCPIVLIHGKQDKVINYKHSIDLSLLTKTEDDLLLIKDAGHNNIDDHREYQKLLDKIL